MIVELFERFEAYLRSQGLQARGGQFIDATLIPVPKQRNTQEENADIKTGRLPEGWNENSDRLMQKDLGPPEKVKPESASTKWTFIDHAARSARRSYLRLRRQSTDTLAALIDLENV